MSVVDVFEVVRNFSYAKVFELKVVSIHDSTSLGARFDLGMLKIHLLQFWLYGELLVWGNLDAGTREIVLQIERMSCKMVFEFLCRDSSVTNVTPSSTLFTTRVTFKIV